MRRSTVLSRRYWLLAAVTASAFAIPATLAQEGGGEIDAQVAAAADDMAAAEPGEIFAAARRLEKLGPAAVPATKRKLESSGPRATVGLARVLIANKERQAAIDALEKTVAGDDEVAGVLAAELIQQAAATRDDVKGLRGILSKVPDGTRKIAVAKVLRAKAADVDAERILKDYLKSAETSLRADAAFALAEVGNVAAAKPVLDELATEPTERGKRARDILEREKLFESMKASGGLDREGAAKLQEKKIQGLEAEIDKLKKELARGGEKGAGIESPLLEEILRNIRLYYVEDGEKIDPKLLMDAAAKGMVASLDPFSSYMTEKETSDFDQSMEGKYAGIGAVVSMDPKDKILTIIRPIYSGPAYKAGLRSLDKIMEVEGESTFGKTVEDLVGKLKGLPNTKVKIKVYRKGWQKEKEFVLDRKEIQLESVHYAMLPGRIGFISLSQFGQKAVEEVENALVDLERQGMRALVFDLRANPGGLLSAAVDIADKFLKDNKLIVYSKGRNDFIAPYREFRTQDAATHPDYPLVVVVNHASASASEIVSGALQDHKRATLVGENTFGKGSVQQLMKVKATGEKSTLRLTIAKYYLPSGRSIHRDEKSGKGGVDPDIVVENDTDPTWAIQEADKVMESGAVEKYVQALWANEKEKASQFADFDGMDPFAYPGFNEFYTALGTKLEPGQVRRLVRNQIRRLAQDDRGREFAFDLQEDNQLQRSIYECLKKLGEEPSFYKEYAHFAAKFDKAPAAAKVEPPKEPKVPAPNEEPAGAVR
jgi:carboxyl-terminal processing protease